MEKTRQTFSEFKKGNYKKAYEIFLTDETRVKDMTFNEFVKSMEIITGKPETATPVNYY